MLLATVTNSAIRMILCRAICILLEECCSRSRKLNWRIFRSHFLCKYKFNDIYLTNGSIKILMNGVSRELSCQPLLLIITANHGRAASLHLRIKLFSWEFLFVSFFRTSRRNFLISLATSWGYDFLSGKCLPRCCSLRDKWLRYRAFTLWCNWNKSCAKRRVECFFYWVWGCDGPLEIFDMLRSV